MDERKAKIKEFIITAVSPELELADIDDDEPLIDSGIIDSLGILLIMAFLDENFDLDLSSGEVKLENFKDLRTICSLVEEGAGS